MPEIKYIPARGRDVPLQDGRDWPVDEKGKPMAALVESSLYYRRRVADGDLLVAEDEAEAVPAEGPDLPAVAAAELANVSETAPATAGGARKKSNAGASGTTGEQ